MCLEVLVKWFLKFIIDWGWSFRRCAYWTEVFPRGYSTKTFGHIFSSAQSLSGFLWIYTASSLNFASWFLKNLMLYCTSVVKPYFCLFIYLFIHTDSKRHGDEGMDKYAGWQGQKESWMLLWVSWNILFQLYAFGCLFFMHFTLNFKSISEKRM